MPLLVTVPSIVIPLVPRFLIETVPFPATFPFDDIANLPEPLFKIFIAPSSTDTLPFTVKSPALFSIDTRLSDFTPPTSIPEPEFSNLTVPADATLSAVLEITILPPLLTILIEPPLTAPVIFIPPAPSLTILFAP